MHPLCDAEPKCIRFTNISEKPGRKVRQFCGSLRSQKRSQSVWDQWGRPCFSVYGRHGIPVCRIQTIHDWWDLQQWIRCLPRVLGWDKNACPINKKEYAVSNGDIVDINAEYHKGHQILAWRSRGLTFSMRSPSQMSSEKILRPQKRGWKRQKKEILKRWMSGKKNWSLYESVGRQQSIFLVLQWYF